MKKRWAEYRKKDRKDSIEKVARLLAGSLTCFETPAESCRQEVPKSVPAVRIHFAPPASPVSADPLLESRACGFICVMRGTGECTFRQFTGKMGPKSLLASEAIPSIN